MIANYIRVFWQQLRRNPVFSILNILGLALGLGVSYIIALYTLDELSFDRFHADSDRTYRVGIRGILSGNEFEEINTCAPLSAALVEEVPGVAESIRLGQWPTFLVQHGTNAINETNILLADKNFFQFFDFELVAGDPATVLDGERKLVLGEIIARKYFPDTPYPDIIGETFLVGPDKESYEITGVAKEAPKNSHIKYPMILSIVTWDFAKGTEWTSNSLYTYFKTSPGADLQMIDQQLDQLVNKYVGPEIEQYIGISLADFKEQGGDYGFWIQPLLDIHLKSHFSGELESNGDLQSVIIFSVVGIFVLIIAGINFISLATARASDRAKEVGIRKTFGAFKSQLIQQYLFESLTFCILAGILALGGIMLGLDQFNQITNKEFSTSDLFSISNLLFYSAFIIVISFISGIYPSFVLSSYSPIAILGGRINSRVSGGLTGRNLLVGFQFFLTTIAIVLTITVYKQLDMMRNKNLGFDKQQILTIFNGHHIGNKETFKQELLKNPEIQQVNITQGFPPHVSNNSVFRVTDSQEDHLFYYYYTDVDHFETFQIKPLQGRLFEDAKLDSNSVIMNEAAFRITGWQEIDGKQLTSYFDERSPNVNVIGVVQDFHFMDFKNKIKPLLIFCGEAPGRFIAVKIKTDEIASTVENIEETWNQLSSGKTIDYGFVDTQFDQLFETERRLGQLTSILAALTIITACMGLFGLAMYVARRRRKEFSIRKVLGASVMRVMAIQVRYFLIISLTSFIISIPVSYWMVNNWLADFEYRINNDWTIYLQTIASLLIIIMLTVGYQSYRASTVSPTRVLREQ